MPVCTFLATEGIKGCGHNLLIDFMQVRRNAVARCFADSDQHRLCHRWRGGIELLRCVRSRRSVQCDNRSRPRRHEDDTNLRAHSPSCMPLCMRRGGVRRKQALAREHTCWHHNVPHEYSAQTPARCHLCSRAKHPHLDRTIATIALQYS